MGTVIEYPGKRGTTFRLKYKDASGKRVTETLPKGTTAKGAKEALRDRESDVSRIGYRRPDKIRFATFATEWVEEYVTRRALKRTTSSGYRRVVRNHLVPEFGKLAPSEITVARIEKYVAKALRAGLSPRSVELNLTILGLIMKAALKRQLIPFDPTPLVERPKKRRAVQPVLTPENTRDIENAFAGLILETPQGTKRENLIVALLIFRLIMGAGLRKGEVLGLRWKHVTVGNEAQIRVRETYVMSAADEPKSDAGKRTIDIGPRLASALTAHREWSAYSGEDERVACNPRTGHVFNANSYGDLLREAMKRAGVDLAIRPHHGLRHSQVTQSAAAGMDPFALMTRSGHSSMQTTMGYVHLAGQVYRDEAEALEERLYGDAAAQGPS